jgi:hypothetical protein
MSNSVYVRALFAATLATCAAVGGSALAGVSGPAAVPVAQDSTTARASLILNRDHEKAQCYYYRGRYYPYHYRGGYYHYRYAGRYCNSRYYGHGTWYCR